MQIEKVEQQKTLNKTELTEAFSKIFQTESNAMCFECSKTSKQWAEINHAIFLCLNCASQYKQLTGTVQIKSITLDMWTRQELGRLVRGGNERFKKYLQYYELHQLTFKEKLRTKAAQQYRIILQQETQGHEAPPHISLEQGREIYHPDIGLADLTVDEMLLATKQKAFWLGTKTKQYGGIAYDKTKQYGGKAYDKAYQKVTSGELTQDAKEAATKVSNGAKFIWGKLVQKFQQVTGEKKDQPKPNSNTSEKAEYPPL